MSKKRSPKLKAQGYTPELKQAIGQIQNEIYEPVKDIIEHYEDGVTTDPELLKVKEYYFKKKYLNRILAGK